MTKARRQRRVELDMNDRTALFARRCFPAGMYVGFGRGFRLATWTNWRRGFRIWRRETMALATDMSILSDFTISSCS